MYDTIIIGSGAAGLTAAIYAKRAALQFVVIEQEFQGTGQIAEAPRVDNYPGLPGEDGFSLGERFRSHAESLGTEFVEQEVTEIISQQAGYIIRTADGSELHTKTVIYAAGASHRKLGILGEDALRGAGVSYCATCDGAFYENQTVAVIGGGDAALGDAMYLSAIAEKVYLIHRRAAFRANAALVDLVKRQTNIEILTDTVPLQIIGDTKAGALRIRQNDTERELPVNGVFIAVGSTPNTALLHGFVDLDAQGYIVAGEDGKTSARGMFAAGDVRTKQLRQVITAAADGANCVRSIEQFLRESR